MARWEPPNNIGKAEWLGRRLFEEPMLRGAIGQPEYVGLKLHHFEDKQSPQVSLDRMGATSVDRKVRAYLIPRAQAHGLTYAKPKVFDGWATVQAKHLNKIDQIDGKLEASPIKDAEPKDNIYHGHIERPNAFSSYTMALHLKHIFTTNGKPEMLQREHRLQRIKRWLMLKWRALYEFFAP